MSDYSEDEYFSDEEEVVEYEGQGEESDTEPAEDDDEFEDEPFAKEITAPITLEEIVPDDERMTSDIMSIFEKTELISVRTAQIEKTGDHLLTPEEMRGLNNPVDIAKKELELQRSPLMIKRVVHDYTRDDGQHIQVVEFWCPKTMKIL